MLLLSLYHGCVISIRRNNQRGILKKNTMKKFLKNYRILPFFLSLIFVFSTSLVIVYAQTDGMSLSGDEICGSGADNKCDIKTHLPIILKNILSVVIMLGLPLLVVSVTYRFVMAWFAATEGNAAAYKEALKKSTSAILGFMLIVALFGGLMAVVLRYFGVKSEGGFNPLQILDLFSQALIPHAYAATSSAVYTPLPNPIAANNLYELLLSILRLIMRFFIYPALIVIWVWTGFAFVFAQGNPAALGKAKSWFVKAFITTLVVMLLQTFLIAVQGTVQKVLPAQKSQSAQVPPTTPPAIVNNNSNNNGTPDNRTPPKDGTYGAFCTTDTGAYGTIGSDGKCQAGRSAAYDIACNVRNGGTCRKNSIDGTCQDYTCVLPWTDPCIALNQVHASCASQDGRAGTCLFNINTNKFMCQPK